MGDPFWTDRRLLRVALALCIGLIISIPITYINDSTGSSMLKSGDFPGFYVQGEIIKRGLSSQLYDPVLQRKIENELWPSLDGSFYMAVYPPYTAAILYPLTALSPQSAQFMFTGLMCLCLLFSIRLIGQVNPSLKGRLFAISLVTVTSSYMISALLGAQNTALSMLFVSSLIFLSRSNTTKSNFISGIIIGLWAVKPQFAAFGMLYLLIINPTLIAFTASSATFIAYYFLGVSILGKSWPLTWLESISTFGAQNYISNRQDMVSILGFIKGIGINFNLNPFDVSLIAYFFYAFVLCSASLLIFRTRNVLPKYVRYAIAFSVLPLLSPQTLFYDLGIGLTGFLSVADFKKDRTITRFIIIQLLSFFAFFLREYTPIAPFFIFAVTFSFFTMSEIKSANFSDQVS